MPPLSLLFLVLAGQTASPITRPPAVAAHHVRHMFVSPMGEPFTAGPGGDALADWFRQADRNHDGVITAEEMQHDAERFFALLDVNHDGEIDPDEIDRYETQIAPRNRAGLGFFNLAEPVAAADSNFNRGVSLAEFLSAAQHRFAAIDFDHQGRLSLDRLENIKPAPPARERDSNDPSQHLDPNADTAG